MDRNFMMLMAVAAAMSIAGCSTTSGSGAGAEGYDGQGVVTGIDSDGAMTVGDPNEVQTYNGPESLREKNTIYFNFDSDQILDAYVGTMQSHAQFLRNNPDAKIVIEGHTDERGTPEYNIALGERRARSVARYMQNLGVDVGQLSIVSYGEEKPADPTHSEAAWSKNRRAVINY
ncbi:MAG: peptidoglycan-associated lipoprotein Pal [Succinivibrionaceae bacterium]|nr:peptidoglycan-associated lipoprotein Pal [Succinivibrionaceae bacterium]